MSNILDIYGDTILTILGVIAALSLFGLMVYQYRELINTMLSSIFST